MIPSFRVAPPSPHHLAADADAPATVWFEGDRERLQIATSIAGLGIDLTAGASSRVLASRARLEALLAALEEVESHHAAALRAYLRPVAAWKLRTRSLELSTPLIMGILNLTDDSFSGDGVGTNVAEAVQRADTLRAAGAALIDVGAESARADRPVLDEAAESALVGEAVGALVREGHIVSSDTYKGGVARAALEAGAEVVNDISGLTLGTGAAEEAMRAGAGYVLNYSFSAPKQRPDAPPQHGDVVVETIAWMEARLAELAVLGMATDTIAIDPGIAFGKSHDEDIQVLGRLGELTTFGRPVLLAHSRKNFIGSVTGRPPGERDLETHVASALAFGQGVRIFRVHDPEGAWRALEMAAAITAAGPGAFAPDAGSWPWRAGVSAAHMTVAPPDKEAPPGQRW